MATSQPLHINAQFLQHFSNGIQECKQDNQKKRVTLHTKNLGQGYSRRNTGLEGKSVHLNYEMIRLHWVRLIGMRKYVWVELFVGE